MKKYILLIFLFLTLTGCLKLDNNLFNNASLSEYKLDEYDGKVDFRLDDSYNIADSLIHLFTLPSKTADESDATTIYAVYIGTIDRIAIDTVILYCHGNRDHMDFYWPRVKLLAHTNGKNNYGVLMMDYRGFGMSEGSPSEEGLYADADAAMKWLKEKGLTNNRLVIYGFSMGSAPATRLSAEDFSMKPNLLILEAPFASAEVMVQDASGLALAGDFFTTLKIDNATEIRSVKQPFLWIHGEEDDFLNIDTHGQIVYDNYSGPYKEAHRIQDAGHGTIEITMGFEKYLKTLGSFISNH